MNGNLKLAVQSKGRLTEKSLELLKHCGLDIEDYSERLFIPARNFPLDILFLRDDDIPEYVQDGVADVGIVGENIFLEKQSETKILEKLGFGRCSLLIAHPENKQLKDIKDIELFEMIDKILSKEVDTEIKLRRLVNFLSEHGYEKK